MMGTLAFVAQATAVFTLAAAVVATAIAFAYPRIAARLGRLAPRQRARTLFALCALPSAAGAAFLAIALLPSAAALLGVDDHCAVHTHHAHLCPLHPWAHGPNAAGALLLGGLVLAFAAIAWRTVRTRRALRTVASLAEAREKDGTWRVRSPRPFAFTAGLVRPAVYVSTGLREALSASDLAIVVAHERAHARRRDALLTWAAAWLGALHVPATSRRISADLHAACEQACDLEAAREAAAPVDVAAALVRVERLQGAAGPWPSVAFGGGDVEARVESLLAPPIADRPLPRLPFWMAVAASTCIAALLADPLHHAAETLVAFLSN
jgi:Zn-dependent protease with chaperone function